jgi:transcriptional regulator with XRE-family HTH domain
MSQERLAKVCRLIKGYIAKSEKSKKVPTFSALNKIANDLNVDVGILTTEDLELPQPYEWDSINFGFRMSNTG